MGDADGLILAIIGFIGGFILFFDGFRIFRRKRLIENTPTSKVRSIAMGIVEVFGKVVPAYKKLLKSPFSQKDCVHYYYKIEEYRKQGKESRWVTISSGKDSLPFYIQDKTGSVLVDPSGAEININKIKVYSSGIGREPNAMIKSFLAQSAIRHQGWFFNKQMRFTEYYIEPNDNLYILGNAGDNPYVEEGTAANNVDDIMIQKGNVFLIFDKDEKSILSGYSWRCNAEIFGGAILSVVCLVILFLFFGIL